MGRTPPPPKNTNQKNFLSNSIKWEKFTFKKFTPSLKKSPTNNFLKILFLHKWKNVHKQILNFLFKPTRKNYPYENVSQK